MIKGSGKPFKEAGSRTRIRPLFTDYDAQVATWMPVWVRDDLSHVLQLRLLCRAWDALLDTQVRPGEIEAGRILLDYLAEMALAQDEEVQAFAPYPAQESLTNGVGLGLSWPNLLIRQDTSPFGICLTLGLQRRQVIRV